MTEQAKHTAGELWALRMTAAAAEVWTENGRQVAMFRRREDAEAVIEDHNFEVEMDRPEPPEVQRSQEEERARRLAYYRRADPQGSRLIAMTIEGLRRLERLCSLSAPPIILAGQVKTLRERIDALGALFPTEEAAPAKAEGR